MGIKVQQFPVSGGRIPSFDETISLLCAEQGIVRNALELQANGYQNGAEMAADLKNSLLFSLFSGNRRAVRWVQR